MKSLKLKILLPVLVIVIGGLLVVSVSSYFIARRAVVNDIEEITSGKAQKIENFVDGKLEKWKSHVELLAATDMVRAFDYEKFKQYVNTRSEIFKEYEMLFLADKTGSYKTTTDSEGNISDRDYYPGVMKGEVVISEPVISKSTGKPIIVIAATCNGCQGECNGNGSRDAGTYRAIRDG